MQIRTLSTFCYEFWLGFGLCVPNCPPASWQALQKGHKPAVKLGDSKSKYTVAAEALATHSAIDLELIRTILLKKCWKAGPSHTCMDVFRNNPQIIRVRRVMWRCLPAAVRREKLIHMMTASFQAHRQSGAPGDWLSMIIYFYWVIKYAAMLSEYSLG